MRIMTILGSPRRQGNTATVLAWVEESFLAEGHTVDRVDIIDCDLKGCGECRACQEASVEMCAVEDDANGIFRRMAEADLVVFASPVFCWGFPSQLKALIDRMYCLMDLVVRHPHAPRLHGKPMGLVLTAGGQEKDNAELVLRGFHHLVSLLKGIQGGHLFVPYCLEPEVIDLEVKERAARFSQSLMEMASEAVKG